MFVHDIYNTGKGAIFPKRPILLPLSATSGTSLLGSAAGLPHS